MSFLMSLYFSVIYSVFIHLDFTHIYHKVINIMLLKSYFILIYLLDLTKEMGKKLEKHSSHTYIKITTARQCKHGNTSLYMN